MKVSRVRPSRLSPGHWCRVENARAKANAAQEPQASNQDVARLVTGAIANRNTWLSSEDIPSDRKIMAATAQMFYNDIDPAQQPKEFYQKVNQQYGDLHSDVTYQKMADDIFDNTMFFNDDKWRAFIDKPTLSALQSDPAYAYVSAFVKNYNEKIDKKYKDFTVANNDLGRQYLKGVREMNPGKVMYPDATFTMRVS